MFGPCRAGIGENAGDAVGEATGSECTKDRVVGLDGARPGDDGFHGNSPGISLYHRATRTGMETGSEDLRYINPEHISPLAGRAFQSFGALTI